MTSTLAPHEIDAWITGRYERLKQLVMMTCYYDEDTFQDAYLTLRKTGAQAAHIEAQFIKLYRTLLSASYNDKMRYAHPDPIFFDFLQEAEDDTPADKDREALRVDDSCRLLLDADDYALFDLRYKVGLTLREIAAYTGRSTRTIMQKLNDIISRIRAYFSLTPAPCIAQHNPNQITAQ